MPWFYSLKGKGQNLEIFPNENNLWNCMKIKPLVSCILIGYNMSPFKVLLPIF
jgi:hypothetical protein